MIVAFEPYGPRIMVDPVDQESEVSVRVRNSGLSLPDGVEEAHRLRPSMGIVVAISKLSDYYTSDCINPDQGLKVGDVIMFNLHAGMDFNLQGKPYIVLEDREVVGKLIEKKESV